MSDLLNLNAKELKKLESTFQKMKELASDDPVYFIDTFCYTFNPKLKDPHLRFKLFPFQKRLVADIVRAVKNGDDLFIEKCREMGATYTVIATFLYLWLFIPGSNFLLGSRKEDAVDNRRGGTTGNKDESLFGKLDYMLSRLPPFIIPEGFNPDKHFSFMSLVNPQNGNIISGESSNPNFSRGGRFRAIMLDEFAFWDNGTSAWGATADTTNARIVLTTPGDRPSKAKRLRFGKDGEKIKVVTLEYKLDPRKTSAWLAKERERRSTEDFAREILINWETSVAGRVYPEIDSAVFAEFPFIPDQQLYCSGDYGLDGTAFLFWQQNPANGKWRLIDSYCNSGQVIQFYFPLFGKMIDSKFVYGDDDLKAFRTISNYPPAIHFGDNDVKKQSLVATTSTLLELQKAGIFVQSTAKNEFITRRELTKVALQKGIEINDNSRNEYVYEAFKAYRYPQRPEDSQSTAPNLRPIHDWASHPVTAAEYLFLNIDNFKNINREEPSWASKTKRWMTSRSSLRR